MDTFTFIATLVGHLAWPIVALLLAGYVLIAYKPEVKQFLVRLASLKAAGLEVQFKDQMKAIEGAVELQNAPNIIAKDAKSQLLLEGLRLAEISPNAAIIHTWTAVEDALRDSVKKVSKGQFKDLPSTPMQNARWLNEQDYLAPPLLAKIRHLSEARNSVAHSQAPIATYEDAKAYINLADQVISILRNVSEM